MDQVLNRLLEDSPVTHKLQNPSPLELVVKSKFLTFFLVKYKVNNKEEQNVEYLMSSLMSQQAYVDQLKNNLDNEILRIQARTNELRKNRTKGIIFNLFVDR